MLDGKQFFFSFLLSACSALSCAGDDIFPASSPIEALLEMPVMSAGKRPQKPADAPAMVRIISAEEIRAFGWRSLAEALNSLPGLHVSDDRSYMTLGLRGFGRPGDYNCRLLLLIDGIPTNDGIFDQAALGSDFPLDLGLIERIEFVPGPSSSLYGGNALMGIVNIITASGRQVGNRLTAASGSQGRRDLGATLGKRDEQGRDWLLAVSRMRQDGDDLFFPSYAAPATNAWSRRLDYDDSTRVMARYAHGSFLASLIAHQREKGAPGGPYGADLNDPRNSNHDQSLRFNLGYDYFIDTERKLSLNAFVLGYDYEGHWSYSGVLSRDFAENRALGGEARLIQELSPDHTLMVGTSWRHDTDRRQYNNFLNVSNPRHALGLFAQSDLHLTEWLLLSTGGRFDGVAVDTTTVKRFSPRLALIAAPAPETRAKLIFGTAFRAPNGFETDYAYAATNLANPRLKPETIKSLEFGLEHRPSTQTELSASLYRQRIDRIITLETDTLGQQQHRNAGAVDLHGIELAARSTWLGTKWHGSLAFQSAQHESGRSLANAPTRLAKLLGLQPLSGNMQLGWELQYLGPRRVDSGSILVQGREIGGLTLLHATLSGQAAGGWSWQLRAANLFDRRHDAVIGSEFNAQYPGIQVTPMQTMRQDGRTVQGTLRWTF